MHIFSRENSKITTRCSTTVVWRILDPTKKRPHIQGQRRSPRKTVGGVKSHLESNPLPARDTQRAQTSLVCTSTQRLHITEPELCLSVYCKGMGQSWPALEAGALSAADLGMVQALLEQVTVNPTTELPELTQDRGNRLLEDTNRTLWAPGPRGMEQ